MANPLGKPRRWTKAQARRRKRRQKRRYQLKVRNRLRLERTGGRELEDALRACDLAAAQHRATGAICGLSEEDLRNTAIVAMLEAHRRYMPRKHRVEFATFAHRRIRGAVIDLIRTFGPYRGARSNPRVIYRTDVIEKM